MKTQTLLLTATDRLTRCASAIFRNARSHGEAMQYDAGFDAGEFSGPAHCDMERADQIQICREHGFKVGEFFALLEQRTCVKWVHFSFPHQMSDEDEYETNGVHGRNRNR